MGYLSFGTKYLRRGKRDANVVSRSSGFARSAFREDLEDVLSHLNAPTPLSALVALTSLSDRRRFYPDAAGFKPAVDVFGSQSYGLVDDFPQPRPWPKRPLRPEERPYYSPLRYKQPGRVVPQRRGKYAVMPARQVGFSQPWKMVICLKRKLRREVMFALGRTKKGSRSQPHKRSYYSSVRC